MHRLILAWLLVVAACAGNTPAPAVDAAGPAPRTFGAACAMASNAATDCDSQVCTDTIDQAGHPVCSKQCTTNDMCPVGSAGMMCNKKGYCKP